MTMDDQHVYGFKSPKLARHSNSVRRADLMASINGNIVLKCFGYNENELVDFLPCNIEDTISACCPIGARCLSNQVCVQSNGQQAFGGCTNSQWGLDDGGACPCRPSMFTKRDRCDVKMLTDFQKRWQRVSCRPSCPVP